MYILLLASERSELDIVRDYKLESRDFMYILYIISTFDLLRYYVFNVNDLGQSNL